MSEELPEIPSLIPPAIETIASYPYNIAMIIDGTVYQIINVDGQTAAMYLSNPTFVQVAQDVARIGWTYDGSEFTNPVSPNGV
jgi:hypothetical protein